ncbi:hypothetical protein GCM10010502_48560 [Kitasatospora aureofaciens]|uniref:Uncharacterized protein n=1 Tax=Kitasatospora aureofaciens TaxID=1894 RepID=A0A8H9HUX6_KITAU|nr:hypothetical protein GCM10010502_48560 [Kitasatospora aureofaciens]
MEPASGTGTGQCVTGELAQDRSGARAMGHWTEVRTAVRRGRDVPPIDMRKESWRRKIRETDGGGATGRAPGARGSVAGARSPTTSCAGGLVAGGGPTPQGRDQDANPAKGRVDIGAGAGRFVAGELTPQGPKGCSGGVGRRTEARGPVRGWKIRRVDFSCGADSCAGGGLPPQGWGGVLGWVDHRAGTREAVRPGWEVRWGEFPGRGPAGG